MIVSPAAELSGEAAVIPWENGHNWPAADLQLLARPREIRNAGVQGGDQDVVSLGEGLMTLQSIMGQGLINAVTLNKIASNAAY